MHEIVFIAVELSFLACGFTSYLVKEQRNSTISGSGSGHAMTVSPWRNPITTKLNQDMGASGLSQRVRYYGFGGKGWSISNGRASVGGIGVDVAAQFTSQIEDGGEHAASDDVSFDLGEP